MPVARALGVLAPGLLLIAVLWLPVLLRRRTPEPTAMDAWRSMSTEAQAAHDEATIANASEAAGLVADREAEAVRRNALFHP